MKKTKILVLITALALVLSGCAGTTTENGEVDKPAGKKIVVRKNDLTGKMMNYTEVANYVCDVDADGEDETIILSTSAEKNGDDFLWNDGQDWALYVKDTDDKGYILYHGFVQAGSVNFDVSDYYLVDTTVPKITVTVSTNSVLSIKNFTFDSEDKLFVQELIYDSSKATERGINRRFTSLPMA